MKRLLIIFALFYTFITLDNQVIAQSVTLDLCIEKAYQNYPAIKRNDLLERSRDYNLSIASKAYLPNFSIQGQATYQTEVLKIPIDLPFVKIPTPDKDQYQVTAKLEQIVWDGGRIRSQKEIIQSGNEIEMQKLNIELHAIKEKVIEIYFGILLLEERLVQQTTLESEMERQFQNVKRYIENGVANETDLNTIKVEQLRIKQQRINLVQSKKAFINTLSYIIGENIAENADFTTPQAIAKPNVSQINREEYKLFDSQKSLISSQEKSLKSLNMPTFGVFAQGGYGKPGLNFISNKFEPFAIFGASFNWNFGNLYTNADKKHKFALQKSEVDIQKQMFDYQLNTQIPFKNQNITLYEELMEDDGEIISLRKQIKEAAEIKVENGTMNVSDLLKEIHALEMANQEQIAHKIQHLHSLYSLKSTLNQ